MGNFAGRTAVLTILTLLLDACTRDRPTPEVVATAESLDAPVTAEVVGLVEGLEPRPGIAPAREERAGAPDHLVAEGKLEGAIAADRRRRGDRFPRGRRRRA